MQAGLQRLGTLMPQGFWINEGLPSKQPVVGSNPTGGVKQNQSRAKDLGISLSGYINTVQLQPKVVPRVVPQALESGQTALSN